MYANTLFSCLPDKCNVDPGQNEAKQNWEVHKVLTYNNTGTPGYVPVVHGKLEPNGSSSQLAQPGFNDQLKNV